LAWNARLQAYLAHFYNPATWCYSNCSDVSQIFGLSLGLHEQGSADEAKVWAHALAWFDSSGIYPNRFGGGIVALKLVYVTHTTYVTCSTYITPTSS
jgi:hypothetical protein